jgi:2-oxoglutarate/2-oxoacid ferredoxin oxidoreductase subunit beta
MSLPNAPAAPVQLKAKDFKRDLKPVWCPGCGDYGVVNAIYKAMAELGLEPHNTAIVSGIGCSSRLPGYVNAFGFNGLHGRALPIATGVKLASPETATIVTGGDGDGFAIGMGHFPHAARRNLNLTYIMMDNRIYGLTKGQCSPTSEPGLTTKTSSSGLGNIEKPINPAMMALSTGVTFLARAVTNNIKHMTSIFKRAIEHRGFSYVQVLSPCVTFRGKTQFKDYMNDQTIYLEDTGHDTEDFLAAQAIAQSDNQYQLGVLYHIHTDSFLERYAEVKKSFVQHADDELIDVVNTFLP